MSVDKELTRLIESLKKTDLELATAIKKWSPRILKSIYTLNKRTRQNNIDLLQDFMVRISQAARDHRVDQFRINGKLYEIEWKQGQYVKLSRKKSLKSDAFKNDCIYSTYHRLVPIKKTSLSSLIYRVVHQTYCDIFQKFYTRKNGFTSIGTEEKVLKARGSNITKFKKTKTRLVECNKVEVSLNNKLHGLDKEWIDALSETIPGMENIIEDKNLIEALCNDISDATKEVLTNILRLNIVSTPSLAKNMDLSTKQIDFAKADAIRAWDKANAITIKPETKKPIVMSPEQLIC